jgi:hypothetical protein
MSVAMKKLIDLSNTEAKVHFMKGSSYFNADLPAYISFDPTLSDVADVLAGGDYQQFKKSQPASLPDVNYSLIANKDGKFSWRPFELMHPAIYVSLVNAVCAEANWALVQQRFATFAGGVVDCCSSPVVSSDQQTDVATQIASWWQNVEQKSLTYSLEFSHLLHTDVTDCYGSLYTHSIAWALHGLKESKNSKGSKGKKAPLLGDTIDEHIRAGRYGQTNGISQGSVLMDLVAEIVLGYVDGLINEELSSHNNVRILRYRDDYRIFARSDESAEYALKVVSDKLRTVGMRLGVAKTFTTRNVVEGSIKPDKLAGIDLQDLGESNAKTVQKQLLRLHAFGQRFPNSGALRRLVAQFHEKITGLKAAPEDLEVLVAIATDIGFVSPATFPAIAGILSGLISLAPNGKRTELWNRVRSKMARVPYNGYLEIWLQRVTQPKAVGIKFDSNETICQIVNGHAHQLWNSSWISSAALKSTVNSKSIVVAEVDEIDPVIQSSEIALFKENAEHY